MMMKMMMMKMTKILSGSKWSIFTVYPDEKLIFKILNSLFENGPFLIDPKMVMFGPISAETSIFDIFFSKIFEIRAALAPAEVLYIV